jgi:hypothetical protein
MGGRRPAAADPLVPGHRRVYPDPVRPVRDGTGWQGPCAAAAPFQGVWGFVRNSSRIFFPLLGRRLWRVRLWRVRRGRLRAHGRLCEKILRARRRAVFPLPGFPDCQDEQPNLHGGERHRPNRLRHCAGLYPVGGGWAGYSLNVAHERAELVKVQARPHRRGDDPHAPQMARVAVVLFAHGFVAAAAFCAAGGGDAGAGFVGMVGGRAAVHAAASVLHGGAFAGAAGAGSCRPTGQARGQAPWGAALGLPRWLPLRRGPSPWGLGMFGRSVAFM